MGYVIQLAVYEGPFDLLLDLISKNEIDIWDIPIADITQQYLEYLYSLQEQNLAVTGEFLVMAATLIQIKAQLLLPKEPEAEEELEEEEDPRLQLVEQLLRYKFFKEAGEVLQKRYEKAAKSYTRGQKVVHFDLSPIYTSLVGDLTLEELGEIYQGLITETKQEPVMRPAIPRVSVKERLALVRLQLMGEPRLGFSKLLQSSDTTEIVVTFLAVLELVRLGEVQVIQDEFLGEIEITPLNLEVEVKE